MAPKPSKRAVAATAASTRKSVQFWGLTGAAVVVLGFGVWLAMAPIPGDQRPPMGANAAFDRAQRYHAQGEGAKAIAECQAVVDRAPEFADGHYTLALYMRLNGDHSGSLRHNQLAFRFNPKMPEAYINAGVSAVELGDRKLAREYYLKALEINPQFFAGFNSMGILDQDEGRVMESREWYRKALAVRPQNSDEIRIKLALIMPPVYQSLEMMTREWARVRKDVQRLIDRPEGLHIGDAYRDVGMAPFYLAYSGLNARPIMESVYRMFSRADPNLNFVAPHLQAYVNNGLRFSSAAEALRELPLSPGGKYRVGIISRHFRWHSIGKFMRGIIKFLPRDRIELYVLFPAQSYDDTSREIELAADRFVRVNLQLRVARQQIAQLKLHALMYADIGMESFTYYLAFSRLAPVQMVTHGHPCTTGLPSIDYFVSFEQYEPQSNQKFYSEQLVRIAGYSSRYIRPQPQSPPQNRTAWGFTYDDHIYMAPQSIFKFHPSYDGIMVGVLAADPNAKLSIIDERHEGWAAKLLARLRVYAKDHAIDPAVVDRIVFVPRVPNAVFLNYLAEADVLLDPHPFGGDTSTREALLMGTPVVTMESEQLAGRYSSAFVRRIGLGAELVVPDAQRYVKTALRIGTDAAYRADLKRRVAASSHVLFDDQATVDAWAKLYVEKVQSAMRGDQIVRVQHSAKQDGASKADSGVEKKSEKAKKARRS